jgi:hypothetical protein
VLNYPAYPAACDPAYPVKLLENDIPLEKELLIQQKIMIKALFKDTAIYGLADFLFKFISFATFPIFTYALTVSEFGIFSLLITISTLVGLLMMCGRIALCKGYVLIKTYPEKVDK